MRYETLTGFPDLGIVLVDVVRDFELSLADFMEDAVLLAFEGRLVVSIGGATSETSQLHCALIRYHPVLQRAYLTLKNSPRVELYGLQGFPLTYFRSFVNQNRRTSSILSNSLSESPMAMKVLGWSR